MNEMMFKGCGTALVTPFTADGEVDYKAYAELIDRQVEAGVHFLVALATTGETPALSTEEKIKLLQLTREHCGDLPLLVGCGTNSLNGTLANMELLSQYGVDGWLVVVPYYNKPTQEGMYQYFKAVAEKTDKPIVLYNVPGRTGANMTPETCVRLAADVPNIVAIKEASGKIEQAKEILHNAPEGFCVLSGDDDLTLTMMQCGAKGVISVASNIVPEAVATMTSQALDCDWHDAEEINRRLQPLFKACFVESNPIPAKAALEIMGLATATVRLPLSRATEATFKTMQETLAAITE